MWSVNPADGVEQQVTDFTGRRGTLATTALATPVPIREFLIHHTVRTAAQEHWDTGPTTNDRVGLASSWTYNPASL